MIFLYSDGSSTGRSNREWGWGFVIKNENNKIIGQGYGGGPSGTNNIAELEGAIQAFCYLINNQISGPVTLVSDSQYVLGIATGEFCPQKNLAPCYFLRRLIQYFNAKTQWVKGHNGDVCNEIADKLAKLGKSEYSTSNGRFP